MSDREVRDQLMTLLLAGHETTATGLAWTLDLLDPPPGRARARARTGGDEYLRAVVAESLRLRPVVPLAGRRLVIDLDADGLTLPAGTDVTPAMWLAHTRPEAYPEPVRLPPERFLDKPPSTYTWIPFGGGVRRCIGAPFAEMEMRDRARARSSPASTCAPPAAAPSASRAATSPSPPATAPA